MLRPAEEVLLHQLGLAALEEPTPHRHQLTGGRTMWQLLELAARDHSAMAAQVRELGEEQDLVELRRPPGPIVAEPAGDVEQQLRELGLVVTNIHRADVTEGVRR